MSSDDKLMKAEEVAAYLGIRLSTVYAWVKRRQIPHVALSIGKRKECVRFRRASIDRWLEQREREAKGWTKWDRR